ncbi:MAG: carbamoyltransferase HypF [Saprospiraceae bacterium]|jgi:hydrogenase maturation protein HypF|nr:carbamoyltransferase HypF [Saprospiraceae bacterium]
MLSTFHLHIAGQVQGVGFRPFIWRLARVHGLNGWVNNTTDGVHVVFNAESPNAFRQAILQQAPTLARISEIHCETWPFQEFQDFQIVHSDASAQPNLPLTPDFALCADCRRELHDPNNRRFGYPFITCTNCGPRYSILTELPYDREHTSMAPFEQCPECRSEFENPEDRRYFSQTNSCPACGIRLEFRDAIGSVWPDPIGTALTWLRDGKILAIKGIGGFLLLCDATNASAIRTLRHRKHRPTKPFALLYPNAGMAAADTVLLDDDLHQLESPAAPIVLLEVNDAPPSGICVAEIAPGLAHIGIMLPYVPLLEVLAQGFGLPLVATSGNRSGSPIQFQDSGALTDLAEIADAFLLHNREIGIPQDDSVVRTSAAYRHRIVVRRSRGLAPPAPHLPACRQNMLALGASMKSTFAWRFGNNTYLSQYLGDLESFDTQQNFEHTLRHFLRLFREQPDGILTDKHPDYFSTRLGMRLAEEWQVAVTAVQHHHAHFAAVLAENRLLDHPEPVLGVIWDGTGLGDDGQIWGGEFFRRHAGNTERVGHIDYFDLIAGDKMAREPRLSALSLANHGSMDPNVLKSRFSAVEWGLYQRLLENGAPVQCSSMGRVFDGVAALLGLADKVSYEGEAAMLLEAAAYRHFRQHGLRSAPALLAVEWAQGGAVPVREIVADTYAKFQKTQSVGYAAAYFHSQLIALIAVAARRYGCPCIAFSGGVWQNALLTDLALEFLRPEFALYFHLEIPPNDEGVAFGQLAMCSS